MTGTQVSFSNWSPATRVAIWYLTCLQLQCIGSQVEYLGAILTCNLRFA